MGLCATLQTIYIQLFMSVMKATTFVTTVKEKLIILKLII